MAVELDALGAGRQAHQPLVRHLAVVGPALNADGRIDLPEDAMLAGVLAMKLYDAVCAERAAVDAERLARGDVGCRRPRRSMCAPVPSFLPAQAAERPRRTAKAIPPRIAAS